MPRPSPVVAGAVYARLTTITQTRPSFALYRCECGDLTETRFRHVLSGKTQSCGCLQKERASATLTARQTTHGKFGTPVYGVWNGMLQRCKNCNHQAFKDYGGRGIKVCARWEKFENFYADMGDPPPGLTLERRDNSKNYSRGNCYWTSSKEQANNRRTCVQLTFCGKTMNVTQWAEQLAIPRMLIYDRLKAGWSASRALTTPKRGMQ